MATALSWVRDPTLSAEQQENRAALLHSARSGVAAKVTLRHAPDVKDFLRAFSSPWRPTLDAFSIGCLFALLAMAFASDTARRVTDAAEELVSESASWTRSKVVQLIVTIGKLPRLSQGKQDGRSSKFMSICSFPPSRSAIKLGAMPPVFSLPWENTSCRMKLLRLRPLWQHPCCWR